MKPPTKLKLPWIFVIVILALAVAFFLDNLTLSAARWYVLLVQTLLLFIQGMILVIMFDSRSCSREEASGQNLELLNKFHDLSVTFRSVSLLFAVLLPLLGFLGYRQIEDAAEKMFDEKWNTIKDSVVSMEERIGKLTVNLNTLEVRNRNLGENIDSVNAQIQKEILKKIEKANISFESDQVVVLQQKGVKGTLWLGGGRSANDHNILDTTMKTRHLSTLLVDTIRIRPLKGKGTILFK